MFKSIFSTATFKQSQITIAGTMLNGVLGAFFYILVARFLGPSGFGTLIIAITTMVLISDIVDIGTNTGLVRFVSLNLKSDPDKAYRFLKLALLIKIVSGVISGISIFLLAPFIATTIFNKKELILPLQLTALGVGATLLFTFATSAMQAFQKYLSWSIVNIFTNSLRLVTILLLGYFLILNTINSLLVYIIMPFFGFFTALFLLPTKRIIFSKNEQNLIPQFLKYNIGVAAFTIIAAFSAKLDTYLTASLLSSKEVGIYGAANQLVQIMPQLVSALGFVSSPKFASFTSNNQMLVYFKKFQLLVSGLCFLGILTIPLAIYLIPILFGNSYQQSTVPFIFLFIASLVFLFSIPVHHSIIFYFSRPDVFIGVSIGHLLIILGVGYLLISTYGIFGASVTVLIGTIFNFLYPLGWLLIKLRK